MKRLVLIAGIFAVAGVIGAYLLLRGGTPVSGDLDAAITSDVTVVVRFKGLTQEFAALKDTTGPMAGLSEIEPLAFLLESSASIAEAFNRIEEESMFVRAAKGQAMFYRNGAEDIDLVFAFNRAGFPSISQGDLKTIAGEGARLRQYEGHTIVESSAWSLCATSGLVLVSRQGFLLERVLREVVSGGNDEVKQALAQVRETAIVTPGLELYVNVPRLPLLAGVYLDPAFRKQAAGAEMRGTWMLAQVRFEEQQIYLTGAMAGLSATNRTSQSNFDPTSCLPTSTAVFTVMDMQPLQGTLAEVTQRWHTGNRVLALLEAFGQDFSRVGLLVLESESRSIAMEDLSRAALETKQFGSHKLMALRSTDVQQGMALTLFMEPWCAVLDQAVVIAGSESMLRATLEAIDAGHTLRTDVSMGQLRKQLSNDFAAMAYANPRRLRGFLRALGDQKMKAWVDANPGLLNGWNGLCLQVAPNSEGQAALVDAIARTANGDGAQDGPVWSVGLDTAILAGPWFFDATPYREPQVLVQDVNFKLYAITPQGDVAWSRRVAGELRQRPQAVDYYRNTDRQLLFAAGHAIWIVDHNGRPIDGYPLELPDQVTAGPAVAMRSNGRFSIFLSCANGHMYGFGQEGAPLGGWSPQRSAGDMAAVAAFAQEDRLHVAAQRTNGDVLWLNELGSIIRHHKPDVVPGAMHAFHGRRGISVLTIKADGSMHESSLLSMLPASIACRGASRFIELTDTIGGAFAAVGGGRITVFSAENERLWSAQLADSGLQVFASQGVPGYFNRRTREVMAYTAKGQQAKGFPRPATSPFDSGEMFAGQHFLIAGNGPASVAAYRLPSGLNSR